jgi:3'(2'), 5'-bisphosphate nucleotidase
MSAATAAAQKVLTRGLERLNPDIPVVSRTAHDVPPPERQRWNHFWLVDPLDGEDGFGTGEGEFTVNIALIENQKPIAGVVHAPLSGTTYYAMAGKGAFKTAGDGAPSPIAQAPARAPAAENGTACCSRALGLCRLVELGAGTEIAPSMEWQSAAPQAVARVLGHRLVVSGSGTDLAYNKADWRNPTIRVA